MKTASLAVPGRCAVLEYLSSERPIEKIYIQYDGGEGAIKKIIAAAKERKIPISKASREQLFDISGEKNHQGVVLIGAEKEYSSIEDILDIAEKKGESPFIVICDGIEDPHNLGAIIRSCDGAGVHGVIIPKNSASGVTAAVMKTSAGAAEHIAVCRVSNLSDAIEKLKKKGIWIYAAEAGGSDYASIDYSGGIALVVGSEGKGISRLIKERSDFIISLPMRGKVNSLNVSCAASVLLYEMLKSRINENHKERNQK